MARDEGHRYPTEIPEGEPTENEYPRGGWTCFHCGENFTTVGAAQDHFGSTPDSVPGCVLKVQLGGERGMLMAMRRLEDLAEDVRFALNDENWDITRGPEDAISRAWAKTCDMLAVLQPWREGK